LENFENNNVAPPNAAFCDGPFNSATNDACYSTGALIPGFSMQAIPPSVDGIFTADPGFVGNVSTIVGSNVFAADIGIVFGPAVSAAAFDYVDPFGGNVATVSVFAPGAVLLGSIVIPGNTFIGVTSTVPFDMITVTNSSADLQDNLQFGDCYSFRKEIVVGNDLDFNAIPDRVVEAGITSGAVYLFSIDYFDPVGPNVMIKDVVPREWDAIFLAGTPCSVIRADERRNLFSDNFITCNAGTAASSLFLAAARCGDTPGDPTCHPYECGAFYLNEGAQTWVGRSLLDQTDPLCLAAVKDLNGGGLDYTGAGDEDGDGVDDYTEACVDGTDPCVSDALCGDCLVVHGTPGCDNALCEATVCALDPFCCATSWDSLCVAEAIDNCVPGLCVAPVILDYTPDPDYRRPSGR
jgi:hypothetical protein